MIGQEIYGKSYLYMRIFIRLGWPQYTKGSWLWKLEAIVRAGQGKTFVAGAGGLEYSFYNVFESGLDIGLVTEYLYDSRGRDGQTFFQDDIMTGLRFGFNDA